jgi:Beta-galactosidase
MRDLMQIGISHSKVRLEDLRKEQNEVAEKFARYLAQHYVPKKGASRHDLIKPVSRAIKHALKPTATVKGVAGYVARLQERDMERQTLSLKAYQELEDALEAMFKLLNPDTCPAHLRKAITDRLEDAVYLEARKAQQQFWEDWGQWLKTKYGAIDELNQAWETTFANWERVRFKVTEANDSAKADFAQFKKDREAAGKVVLEVDDAEQD